MIQANTIPNLTDHKKQENILLSEGYKIDWKNFALTCLKHNIRFTQCQAAAKFLMGTETIDLPKHNVIIVGMDAVCIGNVLIEHKQLFHKTYHHYFKVTVVQ